MVRFQTRVKQDVIDRHMSRLVTVVQGEGKAACNDAASSHEAQQYVTQYVTCIAGENRTHDCCHTCKLHQAMGSIIQLLNQMLVVIYLLDLAADKHTYRIVAMSNL